MLVPILPEIPQVSRDFQLLKKYYHCCSMVILSHLRIPQIKIHLGFLQEPYQSNTSFLTKDAIGLWGMTDLYCEAPLHTSLKFSSPESQAMEASGTFPQGKEKNRITPIHFQKIARI